MERNNRKPQSRTTENESLLGIYAEGPAPKVRPDGIENLAVFHQRNRCVVQVRIDTAMP